MVEVIIFISLLTIGYFAGSRHEKNHYASIREREATSVNLPVLGSEEHDGARQVAEVRFVCGSTAVAVDYFKVVAGALKNFFGGNMSAYETLIDRARRESTLRMKEDAAGFDVIINARIETSSIGKESGGKRSIHAVECYCYGTAIRYTR
jgi:uncharacterized protein YbjQ (UPF0145 family)